MLRLLSLVLMLLLCLAGTGCVSPFQSPVAVRGRAPVSASTTDYAEDSTAIAAAESNSRFEQYGKEQKEREQSGTQVHLAEPPSLGQNLYENLVVPPLLYTAAFFSLITGHGMVIL